MRDMADTEIVLNLWYVRDEEGIIYSLRITPYVAHGTDEAKLAFLQERAQYDFLIASPFDVPERFHMTITSGEEATTMPVGHITMLDTLDSPISLFEDAIKLIEDRFPAQSNVSIPEHPLICLTALMLDSSGDITPRIDGNIRYS